MLLRKMLRDINRNKSQFIAIFLMIYLGVFIYTGVQSEWNGMLKNAEQFYTETNLADVIIYGNHFLPEEVRKLEANKKIQNVERRAVLPVHIKDQSSKKLDLHIIESNEISQMKVMTGEEYTTDKDGIWIDINYANENNVTVNDIIEIDINGNILKKHVLGLILHPEYVYQVTSDRMVPDHANQGYAILSSKYIPQLDKIPFTQLRITTKDPEDMEQIVSAAFKTDQFTFLQKQDMASYAVLHDEIKQHQAFGQVFPIVFLLIAVLTTATTVSKLIINQRLQCGVLKALGFKNSKIMWHYFSHIIFITSLGALLGFITGPIFLPSIIYPMMKTLYSLPQWKAIPLASNVYIVIGSVVLCFLIAYAVGHKQLKEKSAVLLRPAVNHIRYRKKVKRRQWNSSHFYMQWNVRDILRNKTRSLIAIIGVCGCMGLLLCAFGMRDSMQHMVFTMFERLQTYEMKVQIDEQANISTMKNKMQGSELYETHMEVKYENHKKTGSLTVQEDTRYLKIENLHRTLIDLPTDGIALSYTLAKFFDIQEGDVIQWRIMGTEEWIQSKVQNIIHTPISQGITMSSKTFLETGLPFKPTSIVGLKTALQDDIGIKSIQYLQTDIATSMDTLLEGMNLMIGILILGAIVLGVVVLYNIGTFSYMEKTRELATLKVLGFKNKQVKKLLRQQNLILTMLGICVGIPFGYRLIYTVISTIPDSMDMVIYISYTTYLGCCFATLIVSILVIHLVSRNVKHIDMVSALKSIE